jgi:hypothetical protein
MMRLALALACVLVLAGCYSERSESSYTASGTFGGKPFAIRVDGQAQGTAGVDVAAAMSAALDGLRGDLVGAVTALRPAIPQQQDPGWLGIIGGAGAALTAATTGYLAVKKREQIRGSHGRS